MLATKEKILVVEDEKDVSRLVRHALAREKFSVTCAGDGETGLRLARELKPDLVVLDLMLPKMGGLDVLRALRPETKSPIMLLTAKRGEMDRVLGLQLGADDYIVKPFSMRELQARIESQLRRAAGSFSGAGGVKSLRIGELDIDFERHDILARGKPVRLAPKELALLKVLIEADGKVLSRDRLLDVIWGYGQNLEIDTRTVDQHVARLRRKLGREGARILTVTNAGYKIKMR
ncbi:MAG TPA: DNA-binding response regulator [Elusimicrobia bacterium]|nr:DNA-binding response regulator [Elusimicrobiota bacterium]